MKSTVLTALLFLVTAVTSYAQFSLLPQIGFEQSRTTLNYGNGLSASGVDGSLKANLKLAYTFKGGHAPFVNVGTSPAPMNFSFSNTEVLTNSYQAAKNNLRFKMEAGYQYTSSPIQLGKKSTVSKSSTEKSYSSSGRGSCGGFYKSRCGERKINTKNIPANTGLNMRLQPAVALAYVPSGSKNIMPTASGFEYNAANWKTAIVPSMGFEFAKGKQKLLTLTVFYTKPLDKNNETITTYSGVKPASMQLSSQPSTWGMTVGVPISFVRATKSKVKNVRTNYNRCSYRRGNRI